MLEEQGIEAKGVEPDPRMVEVCQEKNLDVVADTAVKFLRRNDQLFDGIIMSHVIEHMEPASAVEVLERGAKALRPGGRFIVVTPNPRCWVVISHTFWIDTTHVRPYPEVLLKKVLEGAGLEILPLQDNLPAWTELARKLLYPLRRVVMGSMLTEASAETNHEYTLVARQPQSKGNLKR